MMENGTSMRDVQSVDMEQVLTNSKNIQQRKIRKGKSRQIIIQDDCDEPHESFWCDATNCDNCVLRFRCFTSRAETIIVTLPLEEIDEVIKNIHHWRLRDGSSRARENRF